MLIFLDRERTIGEVTKDRDRFKQQLDLVLNDKQNLDKIRSSLSTQNDELVSEIEKIKLANAELQRNRDHLEDANEDGGNFMLGYSEETSKSICYTYYYTRANLPKFINIKI